MFLHLIHCLGKDKEKRGLAELQTYAITSYPSVDSIKFVVSAMHRGQHNYDNPKINFLNSRVIGGLENVANSIIRE